MPLTGEALRTLRGQRSLRQIAEATGLSHSAIFEAEKGRLSRVETLSALAETYGVLIVLDGDYWIESK